MLRLKWLLPIIIIILFTVLYLGGRVFSSMDEDLVCSIKPFDEFAYLPDDATRPISEIPPGPPWQDEGTVLGYENDTFRFGDVSIELARTNNEDQEIWIFERPFESFDGTIIKEGAFLIYHPKSQTWGEVSAKIGDTSLVVRDLFITKDGTLWGRLYNRKYSMLPNEAPILSRFNETTQRFEAVPGGFDVPITQDLQEHGGYVDVPAIVLDEQDNFWIFMQKDGIYRYDTKTGTLDRQTDLPATEIDLLDATLSIDGSIYFRIIYPYRTKQFLFQFVPETGEMTSLEIPNQTWRLFSGMLVDREGNLWLGAMGYLSKRGR
ncbi:MAG: hypothetical protein GWN00_35555, partial [Aliifodinibius sp.]|nr:hypothetical protein [Fodinibius sp.]NIV15960.1 hypothetical protein [Fodinibius sp.]NIY29915.1 hypothetical protein [Fodinibius sp.]